MQLNLTLFPLMIETIPSANFHISRYSIRVRMKDRFDLSKPAKKPPFAKDDDVYASISSPKSGAPHIRDGVEEIIPPLDVPKRGIGGESLRDSLTSVAVNIHYDATPATILNQTLREPDAALSQVSERDTTLHHVRRIPTDYEIYLAKSQADYEMDTQGN